MALRSERKFAVSLCRINIYYVKPQTFLRMAALFRRNSKDHTEAVDKAPLYTNISSHHFLQFFF